MEEKNIIQKEEEKGGDGFLSWYITWIFTIVFLLVCIYISNKNAVAYDGQDMALALGQVQAPTNNNFFRVISWLPKVLFFFGTLWLIFYVFKTLWRVWHTKKQQNLSDLVNK
jgi:preprotein translocase subunit SecG